MDEPLSYFRPCRGWVSGIQGRGWEKRNGSGLMGCYTPAEDVSTYKGRCAVPTDGAPLPTGTTSAAY